MQYALASNAGTKAGQGPGKFHVFTRDDAVLKTHGAKVRDTMQNALAERGVTVHTRFNVTKVDDTGVSDGSRTVPIDDIVWVTGAQPPLWFAESGLNVDDRGFITVDRQLRATSHPDVFGAGDAVTITTAPRPKSGVFAVRQGPVLAHNIRARLLNSPLKNYRPQNVFLSLISTGNKYAVASYAGQSLRGEWVWHWKDRIDRAFMTKFNKLPAMTENLAASAPTVAHLPSEVAASLEPHAMRCSGCGAKIGQDILSRALKPLALIGNKQNQETDIILGIGDDAAAIRPPANKLLIQTVDSFPAMIGDPYIFGQITANHCLGDIYAMAAKPHSALLIVTLPFAANAKREADLAQLLAGARKTLLEAGCSIAGGHTAEGAELTLGLSINGFADETQITTKRHLQPEQALILTKPIGTGALFAADARGKSKGRWTHAAIQGALQSSAAAADILRLHGATAMTDITGFGLAGHLGDMLSASGLTAELKFADVPILPGASDVVAQGIVSSLQRDNLIWRAEIDASPDIVKTTKFQLLFDPQTAGGLLAGVPAMNASDAIADLQASGYRDATIIGTTATANYGTLRIRLT
jgi:selenide,water dikinase